MKNKLSVRVFLIFAILFVFTGCAGLNTDKTDNSPPQKGESELSVGDPQIKLFRGGGGLQWKF